MIEATNQFVDLLEHVLAFGAFFAIGMYFGISRRMQVRVTFKGKTSNVTHHMTEVEHE